MSKKLPITIPVGYRIRSERLSTHRMYPMPAELGMISGKDAPIAISMPDSFSPGEARTFNWRLFEGKLWAPAGAATSFQEYTRADVKPSRSWEKVIDNDWRAIHYHPFLSKDSRHAYNATDGMVLEEEEPQAAEYHLMAEQCRAIVARSLLIDGILHQPSFGPTLKPNRASRRRIRDLELEYRHAEDHTWLQASDLSRTFPASEGLAVRDLCERHFNGVEFLGAPPTIHIEGGYDTNLENASLESAALTLLWHTRQVPLVQLSRDIIDTATRLRHALQSSYLHRDLPFGAATYKEYFEHNREEVAPASEHLIEPMVAFMAVAEEHLHPVDIATANTAIDMFSHLTARFDEDDDLLSSMAP